MGFNSGFKGLIEWNRGAWAGLVWIPSTSTWIILFT